jgi:group I intron endonuclease
MYICRALLKYGYSNFSFTILEYCEVFELLTKKKYYIQLLSSEYNTVKNPTVPPMTGRIHSPNLLLNGSLNTFWGKSK